MKINTILKQILFYDENNGFAIFKDKDGKIIKGNINISPETLLDMEIELEGEKTTDKYGNSFLFNYYSCEIDDISLFLKELVKYLSRKSVEEILQKYDTPLRIIEAFEKKDKELLNIKGITKDNIEKIYDSFKEKKEILPLASKFLKFGLSEYVINKLYKIYGNKAYEEVLKNPYTLSSIKGFGFKKIDDIALKTGIDLNNENRYKEGVVFAIKDVIKNKGDTLIDKKDLVKAVENILSIKNKRYKPDKSKIIFIIDKMIEENKIIKFNNKISIPEIFEKEKFIYSLVQSPLKNYNFPFKNNFLENFIQQYQKKENIKLSREQIEAIAKFATTDSSIFALSGSAGTGKTTVSKAVIELYEFAFKFLKKPYEIKGCALSGCASNRLKNVTQIDSHTIHSLLRFNGKSFFYNKDNPLPYNFLIIDEASMIDVDIFYALLKAIDFKKTKLFLIGDNAQLPPVGAGEVFNDILEYSNMPKVELKKVFRQSDDKYIKILASYVRDAEIPEKWWENKSDYIFDKTEIENYFQKKNTLPEKNLSALKKDNQFKILEKMKGYLLTYKNTFEYFLKNQNYIDAIELIQILSPMRQYLLGTENLNTTAQQLLNPKNEFKNEIIKNGNVFREGDKVIHIKNITKQIQINGNFQNAKIFNGQMGIITKINKKNKKIQVYFPYENYYTFYNENELNKILKLGYALTIHKAQGSQYNTVIMPITYSHFIMLNNKIFYTGITRAINKLIIVGESYAFKTAVKKKDETKRNTFYKIFYENKDLVLNLNKKNKNTISVKKKIQNKLF